MLAIGKLLMRLTVELLKSVAEGLKSVAEEQVAEGQLVAEEVLKSVAEE